ncbi:MAG: type II toxin-antitoxin system HicB family antitoxin [bacterium]|nr:type II toxin-antitoxin system HicB family antitoxin [bacterium]
MKRKITKIHEVPVVVEKDDANYYFAYAPSLQGCYTEGRTLIEALQNIKEVVALHLDDRKKSGEILSSRRPISFTSVEVAV